MMIVKYHFWKFLYS